MIDKTEEVINLTSLEGDRVSVEVLKAKHEILFSMGETPEQAEISAIQAYEAEIEEKRKALIREERLVQTIGQTHLIFAIAVAVLAVGISVSGMSVVIDQIWLWWMGIVFGLVGSFGVILGVTTMLN